MADNFAEMLDNQQLDASFEKEKDESVVVALSLKRSERKMLRQLALDADVSVTQLVRNWIYDNYVNRE